MKPNASFSQFICIKDGSFYRAYDWSAWLCVNCIKSDMKVTHRRTKTNDIDFAFVGFPITSIDKYTPEGATIVGVTDKSVDIQLDVDLMDESVSFDTLFEAMEKYDSPDLFSLFLPMSSLPLTFPSAV